MSEISLYVTSGVMRHLGNERANQRQIAYRASDNPLAEALSAVTSTAPVTVQLGGLITLVVGDRGAIWRTHNQTGSADFDALFALLSAHPDSPMRFTCELI